VVVSLVIHPLEEDEEMVFFLKLRYLVVEPEEVVEMVSLPEVS
jgi:hypothetical protein